ncbi:S-layer homology domain-containing protein [Indiicoccus explosivorum]|uniref:S-layer homology domain-containing protein n=1 Tax=Indiicoccus explosivorum TaxID=1917864 RepID=UPI000B441F8A|nr:S-layer homology domain-containing protein [Indiicoccus explosivorum]
MKKWKMLTASALIALSASTVPAVTHADELSGRTLEIEMRAMIELGVLSGYEDGTYKPTQPVTRGQFAAFIARALDLPAGSHSFSDVSANSALHKEIGAVNAAGLMSGYTDGSFGQEDLITREQVAVALTKVLTYLDLDLIPEEMKFSDAADFNSSAGIRAVYNIAHYGITSGMADGQGGLKYSPDANATREQAAAFIYRLLQAEDEAEEPEIPDLPEEPEPEPAPNGYTLGYVENGQLVKQTYMHDTYASALQSFAGSTADALYRDGEIIRVKNGVAYGNKRTSTGAQAVTTVYTDPSFSTQATYVQHGRELKYFESNDDWVKVQAGGTVGYVRHNEVELVPMALAASRDSYSVSQWGTLIHHTYNYASKSRGSYAIGPAPAALTQGATYYSADGVHFYTSSGRLAAQHYPYFQYQSVRTKTNYSAAELDAVIMEKLKEINNVSSMYRDAVTKSKLIGMGKHFKAIEAEYNVNALFMLAAAIHEGAYGMSENSQLKNNMFGIKVYDSTPEAGEKYAGPEDSIEAFAREYMNTKYATPFGAYANGAAPGNKTSGFNVKYASDPTWGSKIAGHMVKLDNALGKKDFGRYKLAMTNYEGTINVRTEPVVSSSTLLFTYKARDLGVKDAFGYPLTIIGSKVGADGYVWYNVFADLNEGGTGWIREDLVRVIN